MAIGLKSWKRHLHSFLERLAPVALGSGSLWVFSANARLAMGLPFDKDAARVVLDLYHPQRYKGRFLKWLVKLLIKTKLRDILPVFKSTCIENPKIEWLESAAKAGKIGFLGCNPAHGPRCILGGIIPETGEKFVAKLGFDESMAAIQREALFLDSVKGKYPGVIPLLGFHADTEWILMRLPYLDEEGPRSLRDPRVSALLFSWLGDTMVSLGNHEWICQLLAKVCPVNAPLGWHKNMKDLSVRESLLHGDFAVWNLRLVPEGICALDWEWAMERGVSGIDLAHGLRQECYMVNTMAPKEAISWILEQADKDPWRSYLAHCGWDQRLEDWLRLGLLHSHFQARNDSTELLQVLGINLTSYP